LTGHWFFTARATRTVGVAPGFGHHATGSPAPRQAFQAFLQCIRERRAEAGGRGRPGDEDGFRSVHCFKSFVKNSAAGDELAKSYVALKQQEPTIERPDALNALHVVMFS
jgi:hypothetical protein